MSIVDVVSNSTAVNLGVLLKEFTGHAIHNYMCESEENGPDLKYKNMLGLQL